MYRGMRIRWVLGMYFQARYLTVDVFGKVSGRPGHMAMGWAAQKLDPHSVQAEPLREYAEPTTEE